MAPPALIITHPSPIWATVVLTDQRPLVSARPQSFPPSALHKGPSQPAGQPEWGILQPYRQAEPGDRPLIKVHLPHVLSHRSPCHPQVPRAQWLLAAAPGTAGCTRELADQGCRATGPLTAWTPEPGAGRGPGRPGWGGSGQTSPPIALSCRPLLMGRGWGTDLHLPSPKDTDAHHMPGRAVPPDASGIRGPQKDPPPPQGAWHRPSSDTVTPELEADFSCGCTSESPGEPDKVPRPGHTSREPMSSLRPQRDPQPWSRSAHQQHPELVRNSKYHLGSRVTEALWAEPSVCLLACPPCEPDAH